MKDMLPRFWDNSTNSVPCNISNVGSSNYDARSDKHNIIIGSIGLILCLASILTLILNVHECRRSRRCSRVTPGSMESCGSHTNSTPSRIQRDYDEITLARTIPAECVNVQEDKGKAEPSPALSNNEICRRAHEEATDYGQAEDPGEVG